MQQPCSQCGRALRACEWCGETGVITEGGRQLPVIARPDWDGAYHEPCRDAEQQAHARLGAARTSAPAVAMSGSAAAAQTGGRPAQARASAAAARRKDGNPAAPV